MSQTPYIIKAPKGMEARMHKMAEMDFIMGILNQDMTQLNDLFCDNITFQGKYNKWQLLNYFKNQFSHWNPSASPHKVVQFYVAMGLNCGHKAIMIDDGNFPTTKVESKPKVIVIDSCNSRITNVRFTSNYTDIETYEKLTTNN